MPATPTTGTVLLALAVVGAQGANDWQAMRHCTSAGSEVLAVTNCCGNFVCEPNHSNLETAANCPEDCEVQAQTPAPTPAPPATLPSEPDIGPPPTLGACRNFNEWVPDGHTRVGQGHEYCNLCHCKSGVLDCGGHECGEPFGGAYPTGARRCSHLGCTVADTRPGETARHSMRTHHHHKERNGELHACSWNRFLRKCACVCWSALPTTCADAQLDERCQWPERQSGTTKLGAGAARASGALCEEVPFETPFDPALGPARVALAVATPDLGRSMPWVAGSTHARFTICRQPQAHEQRALHWFAWQGEKTAWHGHSPFSGSLAQVSTVAKYGWEAGARTCTQVVFPRKFRVLQQTKYGEHQAFTPPPLVFGAMAAGEDEKLAAGFSYHLEHITAAHFTVCFTAAEAGSGPMQFAWLAFEREGMGAFWDESIGASPGNDPGQPGSRHFGAFGHFSAAGNVVAPSTSTEVSSFDAAGQPVVSQKVCQTVAYGTRVDCPSCDGAFDEKPTVVVSAARLGGLETSALATHILSVGKKDFTVCSTERGASATPWKDLTWDWMAFVAEAKDVYVAKPGYHMQASVLRPCGLGHYCAHGVRKLIPPGFYGTFGTNTTFSAIKRCGGQKYFCLGGVRHTVADGFTSTGGDSSYTRSAQVRCTDPKFYCKGGAALLVPTGWYSTEGLASAKPCGASKFFCSAGVRRSADPGYFTAGGPDGTLRTSQRPCGGAPWYCTEGVRTAVPAGFVGAGGTTDTHSSYAPCGRSRGERVYCWGGVRHNVDLGYEGIGGSPTTRTAQQRCTAGMRGCGGVTVDPRVMATGSAVDHFMALFRTKKQSAEAQDAGAAPPPQSEVLTRLRSSAWGAEARSPPASP